MRQPTNYINHIVLVLDASTSMTWRGKDQELIKVADAQIQYLAQRSKELDQETRVSVYVFNGTPRNIIWDKDVLRLPSIRDYYEAYGNTALIDASLLSITDLQTTPQKYGDHAFLVYVLTDGQENVSIKRPDDLKQKIDSLPDNWTVAVLVPDQQGVFEAKRFGFPKDNIAVWDANTSQGVSEAGNVIREATDRYMTARTTGVRGTKTLFSTGSDAVNTQTIQRTGLKPLSSNAYRFLSVLNTQEIKPFIEKAIGFYRKGTAFYQLTKTEEIQSQKILAAVRKSTGETYMGDQVRGLIGLPDITVKVKPTFNPEFDIYVQSTSTNRKLVPGTKVLVIS